MTRKPRFPESGAQEPGEGEQAVFDWLRTHHLPDKDAALRPAPKVRSPRLESSHRQGRSPAAWDFPLPDLEIDLHNHTVDEALARIDDALLAMEKAGFRCLRVVHGGGNPGYGAIKRALDRQFRTVWRHRVSFYRTEPDNMGSSLLQLAKTPLPTAAPKTGTPPKTAPKTRRK